MFTPEEKIDQINDAYWRLRAEQVEDDEAMLEDGDLLLHVVHLNPRMQVCVRAWHKECAGGTLGWGWGGWFEGCDNNHPKRANQ